MSRIDLRFYDIEFRRNYRFGFKTYTWFVTRSNFSRSRPGYLTSYTIWCFTTDSDNEYDRYNDENMTEDKWISYIKSRPSTKMYNEPVESYF